MTISRYVPNEVACPVAVDLLATLLRADEFRLAAILRTLPLAQRAELAAFCYSRCHMRSLGFLIAGFCDNKSLRKAAGAAGEALLVSSRSSSTFDPEPKAHLRRSITLASFAA
jgi:hypothetical protein